MATIGERMEYSKQHYQPSGILNGKKIKALREERGWSVDELARRVDLTPTNLERIEREDGNTSTGKISAIAKALGIPPIQLIYGSENMIELPLEGGVLMPYQEPEITLLHHPDRDVTLIRTFAGDGEAYLQIGALKTDIPDEILGDILHVIAVYKLRNKK